MIFIALAADWIGLSAPGTFGEGQILLLLAGIVVFMIAFLFRVDDAQCLRALLHRAANVYKEVTIITLSTFLLLAFLELTAIGAFKIWNLSSSWPCPQAG
jgi:hypothetical protein